jgi:acyl-coenzyme A synthetase/AMP-(fatty) acid ligase
MFNNNIGFAALQALSRHRKSIAFVTPELTLSYADFENVVNAFILRLHRAGVGNGSLLGIHTKDPRIAIAAAIASQVLGAAWIEANKNAITNRFFKITHIISLPEDAGLINHPNIILIDKDWVTDNSSEYWSKFISKTGFQKQTSVARVMQSSGTTGKPKFILITAESEYKRFEKPIGYMNPSSSTVFASLFSPLSIAGFNGRLRVLLEGGTNVEVHAKNWKSHNVNVVLGSPYQLQELVSSVPDDLESKIEVVGVAGARPSKILVKDLLKRFEKIRVIYGSTEMGMIGVKEITSVEDYERPYDLTSDKYLSIEAVNEYGKPLPVGVEGSLRVRNDINMPVFLPKKQEAIKGDNWFYPGDRGVILKDKKFKVFSRSDDVVNIGGVKVDCSDIDDVITSFPEVIDGYSFVRENSDNSQSMHFIISLDKGCKLSELSPKLSKKLQNEFGPASIPQSIFLTDNVPRTSTGKPVRHIVAKKRINKNN